MMAEDFKRMLIDRTEQEYKDLLLDVEYDKDKFKDPATIGLLLYRLAKERQRTNQLFEEILKQLKKINSEKQPKKLLLSEVEQQLLDFVHHEGTVDAKKVKEQFGYKGNNAASARLNALYEKGLLRKKRIGKKVLYWAEQ